MTDGRADAIHVLAVAGPDLGHVVPVLGVVAELRARGHHVTVATGTQREELVRSTGADFLALPLLAPTPDDHDLAHVLWRRPVRMAPPFVDLVREHVAAGAPPVDVVLTDVITRVGGFAAELLGVPWVEISPHHLMDIDPLVPPVGLGRRVSRNPLRWLSDEHIRRHQRRSFQQAAELLAEAREELGLTAGTGLPDARVLCTLPALEPVRRHWPKDAIAVGSTGFDLPGPTLAPPDTPGPLVLVTDTTASRVPDPDGLPTPTRTLGELAREALADLRIRLVITSTHLPAERTGNVVVGVSAHRPLLQEAAVAVAPGGHGFVTQALEAAVPLVLIPGPGDQRETGARVANAGAGIVFQGGLPSPTTLRRAVVRAMGEESIRAAARAIGRSSRGLGGPAAADVVERVAAAGVQSRPDRDQIQLRLDLRDHEAVVEPASTEHLA